MIKDRQGQDNCQNGLGTKNMLCTWKRQSTVWLQNELSGRKHGVKHYTIVMIAGSNARVPGRPGFMFGCECLRHGCDMINTYG